MWIFSVIGFFPAVKHRDKPDTVLVGTRFQEGVERLQYGLDPGSISHTPKADYA